MRTDTPSTAAGSRVVDVELLAIDLATCTRCTGTLGNIEEAIAAVRSVAEPTGTTLRLRKTLIESEEQARERRFASSPTIRVNGRDIVFEARESRCDACTDLCGCDAGTSCRVWSYRGEEHTEAPVGLVIEALLREITREAADHDVPAHSSEASFEVPENLRGFFAGRAHRAESGAAAPDACCPPPEPASCCAPEEEAACCPPVTASCGCA